MWIVPSRNRPHLVERIFSKITPSEPGVIAIDDDQVSLYEGVRLPPNWSLDISPRAFFGPKNNAVLARYPNEPWYGSMNDDMLPETQGWDSILPRTAGPWGIAWADDRYGGRAGCVAFGGELIRALGFICAPGVLHFFNDDAHELIARELGIGRYVSDVIVPHWHFTNSLADYDATYRERPNHGADRRAFQNWRDGEWPQTRKRLKAAIAGCSPSPVS